MDNDLYMDRVSELLISIGDLLRDHCIKFGSNLRPDLTDDELNKLFDKLNI